MSTSVQTANLQLLRLGPVAVKDITLLPNAATNGTQLARAA
jgi:hypothetical protein